MNRIFLLSFSLRNTYQVNSILYALKQIPLVKRWLPASLYRSRRLKVFANVLAVLWEIVSTFLGKAFYSLTMIAGAGMLYDEGASPAALMLHVLFFLTIIGAFMNTYIFNPTKDKYYAMLLMRMDASKYTLIHYGYAIVKVWVGFLPFALLFGRAAGLPLGLCLLIPCYVAGLKLMVTAFSLKRFIRTGDATNENKLTRMGWGMVALLLAAAYGLPALGLLLPIPVTTILMGAAAVAGLAACRTIIHFPAYRDIYQQILPQTFSHTEQARAAVQQQSRKMISADTQITSRRKGFEYLNELFIRRHRRLLWQAAIRIAAVCLFLILGTLLAFWLRPKVAQVVNGLLMRYLPYFVFIMYAINRGTGFTQALFMNCDHSLLTYPFYKQPRMILALFQIRLREIIKVNLLPAAVIGLGLAALLYASGGTDEPLHYAVLVVSILSMSIFFSVHYLTIYYLLQPYNAATEVKSGAYQLVLSITYLVCFYLMQIQMPTMVFGLMTIAFCAAYCVAACALVYKLAPRTFRLRL